MQTQTGATLAHIAARDGTSGCLKVLCEHESAGVDVVNQAGNTPVMFSAMTNDLEVRCAVRMLLQVLQEKKALLE